MQPKTNFGHKAVFSLIWGIVWSGIQETGRVRNRVVFSRCGLNFYSNEMKYINIHQLIKEMMAN